MDVNCSHLDQIKPVEPITTKGCQECLESGGEWVHLRLCMECGHVGCCDNSKNKHATAHFHQTQHAIMQSFESDEDWLWCYVDEIQFTPFDIY